jgi:hypothetical protein
MTENSIRLLLYETFQLIQNHDQNENRESQTPAFLLAECLQWPKKVEDWDFCQATQRAKTILLRIHPDKGKSLPEDSNMVQMATEVFGLCKYLVSHAPECVQYKKFLNIFQQGGEIQALKVCDSIDTDLFEILFQPHQIKTRCITGFFCLLSTQMGLSICYKIQDFLREIQSKEQTLFDKETLVLAELQVLAEQQIRTFLEFFHHPVAGGQEKGELPSSAEDEKKISIPLHKRLSEMDTFCFDYKILAEDLLQQSLALNSKYSNPKDRGRVEQDFLKWTHRHNELLSRPSVNVTQKKDQMEELMMGFSALLKNHQVFDHETFIQKQKSKQRYHGKPLIQNEYVFLVKKSQFQPFPLFEKLWQVCFALLRYLCCEMYLDVENYARWIRLTDEGNFHIMAPTHHFRLVNMCFKKVTNQPKARLTRQDLLLESFTYLFSQVTPSQFPLVSLTDDFLHALGEEEAFVFSDKAFNLAYVSTLQGKKSFPFPPSTIHNSMIPVDSAMKDRLNRFFKYLKKFSKYKTPCTERQYFFLVSHWLSLFSLEFILQMSPLSFSCRVKRRALVFFQDFIKKEKG